MKHPSTKMLFAYWTRQRGNRTAPDRTDIDPAEIRHALGDTVMLAADFVDQLRFRLAGTRVCALFGREIKGEQFSALWSKDSAAKIDELTAIVIDEHVSVVAGLTGRTADGETLDLEMLLLPLAHTGHARIRAIGVLAPLSPPYWLGDKPITDLSLGTLRHVGGDADLMSRRRLTSIVPDQPAETAPPVVPQIEPSVEDVRVRHGFVVYSGGRSPSGGRSS